MNTLRKYVSDVLGIETVKEFIKGNNYLIGSEMGSGKNYWVRNVLLPFASKANKRTLLLSHRVATRDQQGTYLREWEYSERIRFKGGLFTNITYQQFENKILNNEIEYLNQFDFIVCDEAHYFISDCTMNYKTEIRFDWLNNNNNKAIKLFLTGTYKSFGYLPWYNMKKLKEADYYNTMVSELWGYKDISSITPVLEEKVINGEKVLCIFDKIDSGKKFINSTNENAKLLTSSNKDGNKDYDSLVYNQAIDSDILVSTCLLSEGVEIKDKETKTIVLDGITEIERFVQSTARVRDNETKVYYKKPSYQKIINRFIKFENILNLIDEFENLGDVEYVKKYGVETIQKSQKFLYSDVMIDPLSGQEYVRLKLHKCNVANIQYQYDMYEEILGKGFDRVLQEYFPQVPIYDYDLLRAHNLIESKILKDFIGKRLFKEQQQQLKNLLVREYNFKKSGLVSINKEFEAKNIAYELKSKKDNVRNSETYGQRYWILKPKSNS